jgi:nitrite reductase (NO-forming)
VAVNLPIEYALLLPAPHVPPPIIRRTPAHVIVDLEVRELVRQLASGVDYTFWTFDGAVPGPLIRVREGDVVEIRLHNHPSSKLPHNIDLHAVNGSGGGASSSVTAPGHTSTFSFLALNPGIFVYHCATAPVPMHVGSGMYGMILVEPKDGLPQVDREYYVMQGEFYTAGKYGEPGLQPFDPEKADDERPPYVVFNGAVGSLVGNNALQAKTGEKVRIFFGDGGPNLISSFHIIGEVFETVYLEGGTDVTQHNVQTTVVPPGGATIVELRARVPGIFLLVDHALSRAFGKGALGMLKISGPEDKNIYSGKIEDLSYLGSAVEVVAAASLRFGPGKTAAAGPTDEPIVGTLTREMQIERGKRVFSTACFACHQPDGKGLPGVFPPLAGSDFLKNKKDLLIGIPLMGRSGPITVNGKDFNGVMPPQGFTDQQVADVLTYVLNSWGNHGDRVSAAEVESVRAGAK